MQAHPTATSPNGQSCPTSQHASGSAATCQQSKVDGVGEVRHDSGLSDEQREVAIAAAGLEVQECMARYGSSSDLSDRGAADRARIRMQALMEGRSQAQVARMLATQAERMAREPGAEQA